MRDILDEFERRNPHISVRMQQLNWRDGLDKITTSIAAGNASDVCELGSTWLARFADAGVLRDLSAMIDAQKGDFLEPLLFYTQWENRFYGVPWVAGTRVLYYNKEIFKQAGLDPESPPVNWDDFYQDCLHITQHFPNIYAFALPVGENYSPWQTFLPFFWSAGGTLFNSVTQQLTIDPAIMLESLRFYQKLANYSLLGRQAQIDRSFAMGEVAMIISGGWNLGLIPRLNPQLKFGVALVPGKNQQVSFTGGEVLVIFNQTQHPREAQMLVEFLASPEIQNRIVRTNANFIPSRLESLEDPIFINAPHKKVFVEQIAKTHNLPTHPKWSQIQEELSWVIEDMLFNHTDPAQSLQKLETRIGKILVSYSKYRIKKRTTLPNKIVVITVMAIVIIVLLLRVMYHIRTRGIAAYPHSKRTLVLYLFLLPWLAIFLVFYVFPFTYSLILSFTDYSPLRGYLGFCGLKNYLDVIKDPDFKRAFLNTFYFALGTCPMSLLLALGCAVVIYKKVPCFKSIQVILFAPITISVIVAASMFSYFYSAGGFFNMVIKFFHLPQPVPENWLMNPKLALLSVMVMHVWLSFGFYMVIFSAALHAIPKELLEASYIDGAKTWHRFRYIVLPQLRPFILLVIVLNTIKAFQVFPEVYAMTQGGPHGATQTLVYYLYKTGFHQFEMGKASAAGYILLFIIGFFLFVEVTLLTRGRFNER